MSKFSPGVVQDNERLARFAFLEMHIDKRTGRPKPNLFSHIATAGCSVQRDSLAASSELSEFVADFLNSQRGSKWYWVVSGDCSRIRDMQMHDKSERLLCVYDAVEKQRNPSHGEICKTRHVADEGDVPEMRRLLMQTFNADNPMAPTAYRNGDIWAVLSPELRSR